MRYDQFNSGQLKIAANGDEAFFADMLLKFIDKAEALLLMIQHEDQAEDLTPLGEQVHKAKASFKFFGLYQAAQDLDEIEYHILVKPDLVAAKSCCREAIAKISDAIHQAREALDE
jgi:HPt (histidine-containing phosphotransfer) domain-containing protein